MEWLLVIAVVVVLVVLRAVVSYVVGKMERDRAAYNLELDREMLRNIKAQIEAARQQQPHG